MPVELESTGADGDKRMLVVGRGAGFSRRTAANIDTLTLKCKKRVQKTALQLTRGDRCFHPQSIKP